MGSSGEMVTFAELDARANQIAQLLRASGVQTGEHIAMMLKNCREFFESFLAVLVRALSLRLSARTSSKMKRLISSTIVMRACLSRLLHWVT